MQDPFFFGYGSLVNRATHGYRDAVRARISGWRRVWRHTPLRPVAYLTAEPAPGVTLDGLIAAVPGGDWTALDQREYAYDRHAVGKVVDHGLAARGSSCQAEAEDREASASISFRACHRAAPDRTSFRPPFAPSTENSRPFLPKQNRFPDRDPSDVTIECQRPVGALFGPPPAARCPRQRRYQRRISGPVPPVHRQTSMPRLAGSMPGSTNRRIRAASRRSCAPAPGLSDSGCSIRSSSGSVR
ncbi:gamma-glutamylcyclotransferase, partial [Rhodovulum sulfidophilum]|nr:gamma-glutamylcyclotransferase [Rhodovulum sulfidophilum]